MLVWLYTRILRWMTGHILIPNTYTHFTDPYNVL